MRILHAPLNVANDPGALVSGLRELGCDAALATTQTLFYDEGPDVDLSFPQKNCVSRQVSKISFCIREMRKYDFIHFHTGHSILDYGSGIFALLDARLSKMRGQGIAVSFHGSEVRDLQPGGGRLRHLHTHDVTDKRRRRLEYFTRVADLMYVSTPDLMSSVPQACLLPQSVALLNNPTGVSTVDFFSDERPLRIVHMPSSRDTKGTSVVLESIETAQQRGLPVVLDLVENTQHSQALKRLAAGDLLIDQILLGWYGVASIEAAALGVPSVTYIDSDFIVKGKLEMPPFISAQTTEDLIAFFARVIESPRLLAEYASAAQEYCLRYHTPKTNASRLIADYRTSLGLGS